MKNLDEGQSDGVAIIGMAGRFPGADDVEQFWANLVAGREAISFFSDEELAASGLDPVGLRQRGHYVAARGILTDIACFDAAFFGVHPKEAEVMDPQQRVFLEVCWTALERAGYAPDHILGAVGVFAGSTFNTFYQHALQARPELIELVGAEHVMFGNEKDYLSTRVAYKLGLKGPAINVATACSTSLVAVCQACQSLLTYQCDVALAGGVSITVPQQRGYYFDDGQIGSSDGHTRTFDARAAGTVFSNGVGAVVLKRVDEALADGDQIYAVIKGAALNNDGSERVSFGAPGVEGQSRVIAMAHALAGIDPATITCVEAHGTATPLGDPIEIAGLTKAFRLATSATHSCALGSVKTNVGHLDVAAGVAGLIKMSLALHHKIIPPSLHFREANPKLELQSSPFYVNKTLQDWQPPSGVPRRAGVSSFGTGGTNAHVVLEEAPARPASGPSRPWQLLVLSAKTPGALDRATANLCDHLTRIDGAGDGGSRELADAAFTLQTGRSEFVRRRIAVCHDATDGAAVLRTCDARRVFTHHQQLADPPVIFMFPGQGAQYVGMGAELYAREPLFRAEVDRCADALRPLLETDLRAQVFQPASDEADSQRLLQTRFTQPALFVIEYALARLWISWGVKPAAMIGHSVGEYVAGCIGGVLTLEDALSLVARRGALVQSQPGGAMLAVRLPAADVSSLLDERVAIAAINAPRLCVVSGPTDAIAELELRLVSQGVEVRHLHTSHAFHSPMMDPVVAPFTDLVRQITLAEPRIPYISNVSGQWITKAEAISPDYWARHVRETVRFADGVGELLKDPRNVLLEVGPGQALSTLARQHPAKTPDQTVLASLPLRGTHELRGLYETLGRLWMTGVHVDWRGFQMHEARRRVVLPAYPFERTHFWPEASRLTAPLPPAVRGVTTSNTSSSPEPAPVTTAPRSPHREPSPTVARKVRLIADSRTLLQELSGYDFATVDASADLLELGLDSLLLTQAAHLLHRRFGVSITFRQLMEELSSIDAIASFVDQELPAEAAAEPLAPATATAIAVGAGAVFPADTNSQRAVLERLLEQQQLLSHQLQRLLGRESAATEATPASGSVTGALPTAKQEIKGHGPFRPLERGTSAPLSPTQRRVLDEVIAAYVTRTAGSKRLAAEQRYVLADPRSVAGFNRLWKEMVYPIFSVRSDGSRVWDVDGNEYVDFVMGFSASLFGHRPPFVVRAVHEQMEQGFEIGPIQPLAGDVARLVSEITGHQRVAFTNTGSEAVLAAMRLARTTTGRDKVVAFAGAYHGIFDEVLFRPSTVGGEAGAAPIAPGIPDSALGQMIVLDYGNPESLDIIRRRGAEIAAVLVEPVQARRLDLQPIDFLHQLRGLTQQTGSALIIDEIVTGFRVHPAGAQGLFGVRADLATYGKVMGGGLPIGVVAGDPRFMDALDGGQWQYADASFPETGVTFFAGTFVRHPLALAAAKATLTHLKEAGPELQRGLAERTAHFAGELRTIVDEHEAPYEVRQFSSLMQLTFPAEQKLAGLLFYLLRERGIHAWENRGVVMTTSHSDADLACFAQALRDSLAVMRRGDFLLPAGRGRSAPAARFAHLEPLVASQSVSAVDEVIPMTEAQLEVWLASQMGVAGSCAFNEAIALELGGELDASALERALQRVVERHESLRMTVLDEPLGLRLAPTMHIALVQHDLSTLSSEEREEGLQQLLRADNSEAFELERGPLLRLTLIRLAIDRHVLALAAHHLICDGWSFGIILHDLAAYYSAAVRQTRVDLPAPLQASRFAKDDRERKRSAQGIAAEAFWVKQFQTLPDPLKLPTDRPRPAVRSYRGRRECVQLPESLARGLKRLASQHRTTLFATLLCAFETLVYRLTGQDDFVVGIPVAGQPMLGGRDLVAHCINFVPVRATVPPMATFTEFLRAIRTQSLDIGEHQDFTYGSLLAKLRLARSPDRDPLVSTSFTLEPSVANLDFHRLTCRSVILPRTTSQRDLHVNAIELEGGLLIEADYDSDLFDETTVRQWLESFGVLLGAAVEKPEHRLSELPLVSEVDARRLRRQAAGPAVDYPRDQSIATVFEAQASRTPDAIATTCDSEQLSYADLNRRANQLARVLTAQGVGPDTLVGVALDRSLDLIVALLAVAKAGGAYLPLDRSYPKERLGFMLADAGAPLVMTRGSFAGVLPAARLLRLDDPALGLSLQRDDNLPPQAGGEHLAYVMYTSGSTGQPKGVAVPHRAVLRLVRGSDYVPWSDVQTMLHMAPASFDASTFEIWGALLNGARVVVIPDRHVSLEVLERALRSERVDCLWLTGALFNTVVDAKPGMLERVRQLLVGGEALSVAHVRRALAHLPDTQLINGYGPTESTTFACTYAIPRQLDPQTTSIPIGRPIANTQVYVLDRYGLLVPDGVSGELYIGGDGLAREYLGKAALTAERFVPDAFADRPGARLYRTGDLARWRPDGNLEFLGRIDRQIKLRGFRIEPVEIEHALRSSGSVLDAAVEIRTDIEMPHLTAYVVPADGRSPSANDLREHLKQLLPDYMVPSEFVLLPALPLTPNGKIDRSALPSGTGASGGELRPNAWASDTEAELAQIWRDVLGVSAIAPTDNFFDLGGHSLLATRAAMRVRDAFEIEATLATFFETPTIAGMAVAIDAAGASRPPLVIARAPRVRASKDELLRS